MDGNRTENYEVNQIDIFRIAASCVHRIRQIWLLLLVFMCICIAGSVVLEQYFYTEQYRTSASFVVTAGGKEYTTISNHYSKVTMEQLSTSFPYILTSDLLKGIVAEDLGLEDLPDTIVANVVEETNLFQIVVTAKTPELAYDILQSVIKNYPKVAKYVFGDTVLTLLDETGKPTEPIRYPSYLRAGIRGILVSFLLIAALMLFQVMMRQTVKDQEDLKTFLNVKYLGGLPKERIKRRSKKMNTSVLIDSKTVTPVFKEAIRSIQIRCVRLMEEKNYKSLIVTSALAGEGKTTVSCNLAYALANKGYKVLLIDGDLRNPSVADTLKISKNKVGVVDILKGTAAAKDIMLKYGSASLYILPGGEPVEKVSRLYRNGRLNGIIEAYSKVMDFIIIDTPPCAIMNDAALAADCTDAMLLVIRQDYAHKLKIQDGVEMLSSSKASLIGCVINGEDLGSGSYGKYNYGKYGYGRYGRYGYGRYGKYGYGYGYGEHSKE